MSNAIAGPGFLIQVATHAGSHIHADYTTISEAKEIKGPEQLVATVDVTNQSSPGNYKEWLPTLIDGGKLTFPANLLPSDSSQTGLLTNLQARSLMDWQIVIGASGKSMFFSGFVTKWGNTYPVANVAALDLEVQITGQVTGPSATI